MKKTAAAGERHRQHGRLSEKLSKKILMDTGIHQSYKETPTLQGRF